MLTAGHHIKLLLAVGIIVTCGHVTKADTKVISNINLVIAGATRDETISLDNDKNLLVNGVLEERYEKPDDPTNVLKAIIEYVADKNGYRAKYKLEKETFFKPLNLNPSTLKSLGG